MSCKRIISYTSDSRHEDIASDKEEDHRLGATTAALFLLASTHPPTHPSTHPPTHPPIQSPTQPSIHLPAHPPTHLVLLLQANDTLSEIVSHLLLLLLVFASLLGLLLLPLQPAASQLVSQPARRAVTPPGNKPKDRNTRGHNDTTTKLVTMAINTPMQS